MTTNIHLDTNVRGKIEDYFYFLITYGVCKKRKYCLLWYSNHFTDKFLRVYRLKYSSLVMRILFTKYIFTYFISPKNVFERASIGTRASTGTFTLV